MPISDKPDIAPLTGLRGVAAFWVVAYHLLLPGGFVGGLAARVLARGYLAVGVFFVLSGFVMALNYGALFRERFAPSVYAAFLWRRLARLYPIYGVILCFRLAYTALWYGHFHLPRPWIAAPLPHSLRDIPANLLLVQSWGLAPSSIGPAWSISTEWGAYVLFPLLATLVLHRRRQAALACAAIGAMLLVVTAASLPPHAGNWTLDAWNGATPGPLARCLAGFIFGLCVFRVSGWQSAARLAAWPACAAVLLLVLAALVCASAPDLAIYPFFPALILCLATGGGAAVRLFAWTPLLWLGDISYSLYLLHIFLLHPLDLARAWLRLVLPPGAADALAALVVFAFLLAASDLSYRLIERPGRRLLAGLVQRR